MQKAISLLVLLSVSLGSEAIKPSRKYIGTPTQYGFSFVEKKIKTPDTLNINIWDIAPKKVNKNNNVSIVFCGSDAGNMSYLLAESLRLVSDGYNVVMFDYRGFGQSDNFDIDTTLLFHQKFLIDFETVLRYVKQKNRGHKIGTMGFSMGGYFPLITKEKIDFMIADSPMISPNMVLSRLNKSNLKLPKDTVEPQSTIVPQLIFIANKDIIIKFEDIPKSATPKHCVYAVMYDGGHLGASYQLQDIFFIQIETFINLLVAK